MKLDEKDVRTMVRLIGEVAALPGGHAEKKRYLMDGLRQLIDADAWAWALACRRDPTKSQVYISAVTGGFSDEALARWLQAIDHPESIKITSRFFMELEEKKTHLTRAIEPRFQDATARAAWKEANVEWLIISQRPLDENSSSAIGIYRRLGREKFSPRESMIAHIILSEVPWLHEQGWPQDRGVSVPSLSRRQRLTLNLLVLGQSHKQIADQMKISLHTVQGYIKEVYRHFQVSSQAELMNRFFQGNGMDKG